MEDFNNNLKSIREALNKWKIHDFFGGENLLSQKW